MASGMCKSASFLFSLCQVNLFPLKTETVLWSVASDWKYLGNSERSYTWPWPHYYWTEVTICDTRVHLAPCSPNWLWNMTLTSYQCWKYHAWITLNLMQTVFLFQNKPTLLPPSKNKVWFYWTHSSYLPMTQILWSQDRWCWLASLLLLKAFRYHFLTWPKLLLCHVL